MTDNNGKFTGHSVPIDEAFEIAKLETLKGGLIGFTVSSSLAFLGHRFWPLFRSVSIPGKFMLISMATAGYAGFRGEHSLYRATRGLQASSTSSNGNAHMATGNGGSWSTWLNKRRVEVTAGTMACGLGACWLYFRQNQDRTAAQKFMSMRLFTQGLVLCTVLGIVGLTTLTDDDERHAAERPRD